MKLMKKVMAIALAGALALTVLTGCGGKDESINTSTIVNAMNDMTAGKVTFSADSALDKKAQSLAEAAEKEAAKDEYKGKTYEEIYNTLMYRSPEFRETMAANFSDVKAAELGNKDKPLYEIEVFKINDGFKTSDCAASAVVRAMNHYGDTLNRINVNGTLRNRYELKNVEYDANTAVGTANCNIAGQKVMIVIYTTMVKSVTEYPEQPAQ